MSTIIINGMLIMFPILIYLLIGCYDALKDKKTEKIVFIITMCTSLYLCLNFNEEDHLITFIFCNIPILICYLKKEGLLAIILSILILCCSYYKCNICSNILIFKYILYFISYMIFKDRREFKYYFFRFTVVIQGFLIGLEYFLLRFDGINNFILLIINALIVYFITFLCLYFFKLVEDISNLYKTYSKIQEDNKLKNALFKLTHEIKNPLAVCKGYLDMINLNNIEKSERYVYIIKSEIDRSLDIISDFMEYSKIKINKEVFDMGVLLDEMYDSFLILLNSKGIEFKYNNKYDEIYYNGDYNRLKQVLVNLIKNSVESIIDNGIISLSVDIEKDNICIIIEDNGVGMDREELDKIYDMFYTTKRMGTGLGVSLSREIISSHGGRLVYESNKGIGTKCYVYLPYERR